MRDEDDVSIEADEGEVEKKAEHKIAKLREELKSSQMEKREYLDGWQRSKADYVNLLKRLEGDLQSSESRGKIKAVETLLPAFDALERAKEHGDLPEGFLAIAKQLETAFASLGLEELGTVGEVFNPAYHEALGQDRADSLEMDNVVTVVLEKGWKIGDAVIRPAKVRVGHFS